MSPNFLPWQTKAESVDENQVYKCIGENAPMNWLVFVNKFKTCKMVRLFLKNTLTVSLIIVNGLNPCARSISTSYSVIVRVRVVLKRTVVGDWHFDNLSGSHLESQVNSICQSVMSNHTVSRWHPRLTLQILFTWLWRWLPLGLSKRQSPTTVSSFQNYSHPDDHIIRSISYIHSPYFSGLCSWDLSMKG